MSAGAPAVYLNGATLMSTPTDRLLAVARSAGFAGIEARAERLLADADEARRAGSSARPGEVLSLNGVTLSLRIDGALDRATLEADLEPRLELCRTLSAPYLLAVPPRAPGVGAAAAVAAMREGLELARDRGGRAGVRIGFEFLGFADCPINTPALAAEVVSAVEGVDVVLDSCHWHASGAAPLGAYPVGRLALVHLNDAPAKPPAALEDADRVLPGDGVIALLTLVAELRSSGYAGPWSVETFNPVYWTDDPEAVADRAIAAARRLLGGAASA